ncbi:S8 family serine peptidase [Tuberibacillus sp. Marseille-P3662]|uniref:S8 family serine peptidase n=1 Tax=Tuberibacillus sp. Marseille-P3662 TaxID=1965358 RepID=UPI000A1CAD4C|nr:S8 family serine peptidase [Tuberibacillus sp. Marseille-P3662]
MKKHIIVILLFTLCLSQLAGCAGEQQEKDDSRTIMEQEKGKPEFAQQEIGGSLHKWYQKNITGKHVKIAILDTGIDRESKDLSVIKGRNFVGNDPEKFDVDNGHGTKITGIIGARENHFNMRGIAPKSDLYIAKVADENGNVKYENLIDGINWAIKQNVNVINISLEFQKGNSKLHEAIKRAANKNIIIIASSGNILYPDDTHNSYPGTYPEVISVGMLNTEGKIYSDEFKKKKVDVYAPGEDIVSLWFDNKMTLDTGVSYATAYTSGYAALIIQKKRQNGESYNQPLIKNALQENLQKYIKSQRPISLVLLLAVKMISIVYVIGLVGFLLVYFIRKRKRQINFPKKTVTISLSLLVILNILAVIVSLLGGKYHF